MSNLYWLPQSAGRSPDRLQCNAPQSSRIGAEANRYRGNVHAGSSKRTNGSSLDQRDQGGRTSVRQG